MNIYTYKLVLWLPKGAILGLSAEAGTKIFHRNNLHCFEEWIKYSYFAFNTNLKIAFAYFVIKQNQIKIWFGLRLILLKLAT